jgi:uncharacterized protein (DUF849 family)
VRGPAAASGARAPIRQNGKTVPTKARPGRRHRLGGCANAADAGAPNSGGNRQTRLFRAKTVAARRQAGYDTEVGAQRRAAALATRGGADDDSEQIKVMANKVIISCAITGSIHTPTMSEALPVTPDQIATQAVDAAKAGAAILHLHARDPRDGRPSPDPKIFMQFLPRIKQACDAVVNITTGGAVTMTVEERISAAQQLSPEMCSLNMGSMNFALYPMARRYKKWKYDWEEGYLLNSDAYIFPNTFRDIEKIYKTLGEGHGVKFEHECYDTGHLYNLAHCIDRGLFKPPVFVQLIFGILGGIGADLDNLVFMKRTADRLFGNQYLWSVLAGGRHQMNFCTTAAMMGGNVRVGLEDSLYIGPGRLAASNAEQVAKIRRVVEELGYEVAAPSEARAMLGLKGADRVKF